MKSNITPELVNALVARYEGAKDLHELAQSLGLRSKRHLQSLVTILRDEGVAIPKRVGEIIEPVEDWKSQQR